MSEQKKTNHLRRNVVISLALILVVAIIVIFAVPVMGSTYYEKEPYIGNETYTVSEPYTTTESYWEAQPCPTTESYWESEPYTSTVNIDYRVTDTGIYNWFWTTGSDVWVTIKNADIQSGYFYVTFNLRTNGGATATRNKSMYIALGEEQKVMIQYDGDNISTFTYSITPPTKQVTSYHQVLKTRQIVGSCQVQKTRDVIQYHDVEKTREVTLLRDVEKSKRVTIFEHLTE